MFRVSQVIQEPLARLEHLEQVVTQERLEEPVRLEQVELPVIREPLARLEHRVPPVIRELQVLLAQVVHPAILETLVRLEQVVFQAIQGLALVELPVTPGPREPEQVELVVTLAIQALNTRGKASGLHPGPTPSMTACNTVETATYASKQLQHRHRLILLTGVFLFSRVFQGPQAHRVFPGTRVS